MSRTRNLTKGLSGTKVPETTNELGRRVKVVAVWIILSAALNCQLLSHEAMIETSMSHETKVLLVDLTKLPLIWKG